MHLNDLIRVLQAAVSPVALISGVGLLILSMTNRLARVVDRARQLGAMRRGPAAADRSRIDSQLRILARRARLLRWAILLSAVCVLVAALLVIVLFVCSFLQIDAVPAAVVLFVACLLSLVIALISFIEDINLSLVALDLDLEIEKNDSPAGRCVDPGQRSP